jgi:hypothetical protein
MGFLGLVSISGIVANAQVRRKELEFKVLENKERRYKSCLLYMDVFFHPKNIKYLSSRQPDIHTAADVIEYLKAEYHEMILYASESVILNVKAFIELPTRENFLTAVLAMRQDLGSKHPDLAVRDITLVSSDSGTG